jgi:DNA-binding MarR family transcriptional regulator
MPAKFFHSLHRTDTPLRQSKVKLSHLHKAILRWLHRDLRQQHRTGDSAGVPYPALVQAMAADKAAVTDSVCYLVKRGLISAIRPPDAWVRYVMLTADGEAHAKSLSKEERKTRHRQS